MHENNKHEYQSTLSFPIVPHGLVCLIHGLDVDGGREEKACC